MIEWKRALGPSTLLLFGTLIFILQLFISSNSLASEKAMTVEATGFAAIADSNTVVARDSATADALRKAVEQTVGAFVSSDTVVESYEVLRDSIYTRTEGYVKSYAIIGESQADGAYTVKVRAIVASGEVEDELDALGLIQRKAQRPRVLFMIAEKRLGKDSQSWSGSEEEAASSEVSLKETFLSKGFSVVAATKDSKDDFFSSAEGLTIDDARKAGERSGAGIVVFGKATVRDGPRSASFVTIFFADISAEAVRVDDGSVLAAAEGHGIARHISSSIGRADAITKASRELSDALIKQITAKWAGQDLVIITLKGAPYEKAVEFKRLLRSRIRGVDAVYQRRFEGTDTAFEVESKIPAQAIADEISRQGYKVIGATGNTIEVEAGN
ncbi:MAG: hypothetical protein A2054_05735 [Deltaproteobacteria bacterium GWA2_55_10]|nr:MAG: hypothetical protein A2054_05735 [Deltaproteobacteria bacterium GWA2_55_10]